MNVLNDVFVTVKRQCCKQTRLAQVTDLGSIARMAKVPLPQLNGYLDQLQDMGLIRYSAGEYIYLTELGHRQESAVNVKEAH